MDEMRIKRVEVTLEKHQRRLTDHEERHLKTEARMSSHEQLIGALQQSTATQEKMIQVGEDIILALGWAAKAAKWTLTMAAFCTAVWHGIKLLVKAAAS
jgi:hypothetical protein